MNAYEFPVCAMLKDSEAQALPSAGPTSSERYPLPAEDRAAGTHSVMAGAPRFPVKSDVIEIDAEPSDDKKPIFYELLAAFGFGITILAVLWIFQ